jgi:hypothetical protein
MSIADTPSQVATRMVGASSASDVLCCVVLCLCAGDYFDPMFVKPMVALRPLHYSAEVSKQLAELQLGDAPSVL